MEVLSTELWPRGLYEVSLTIMSEVDMDGRTPNYIADRHDVARQDSYQFRDALRTKSRLDKVPPICQKQSHALSLRHKNSDGAQ